MTIYAQVVGGLANQVFIYAAALALAGEGCEHHVKCDTSWLDAYGEGSGVTARKFELELLEAHRGRPPSGLVSCGHNQMPEHYDPSQDYLLKGYFQDLKYWHPWIRELLRSRIPHISHTKWENTVAIQVRRGDYANSPGTKAFHGLMGLDYFVEAAKILRDIPGIQAAVFSDEPDWCREYLIPSLPIPARVQSSVIEYPWQDIAGMANCRYHIISNSTFGWLGAYLAAESNGVIYPKVWFAGGASAPPIFLPEWVSL